MDTNLARSTTAIPSPYSEAADLVRHALIERGLETPLLPHQFERDEKYRRIKNSFSDIARTLGLDLSDDSLCETPHRIAKMYVDEIFSGLDYFNFPKITVIDNKMGVEEMVKVSDISLTSTCEHHFVTTTALLRSPTSPVTKLSACPRSIASCVSSRNGRRCRSA